MRFVPLYCIREGMIVGKSLYGRNGELLLNTGTRIYPSYINKLRHMGFNGIYIEDNLSEDIEVVDIISDNLRNKTIQKIKDVFHSFENKKEDFSNDFDEVSKLVSDIIDNIMSNKNLAVNMIDIRSFDDYTFYHSVNVGVLSIAIGVTLNFDRAHITDLGLSAMLHDIGKVFIPKEILNKPSKLNDEEFELIKMHPANGYKYLKGIYQTSVPVYIGALQHHERYDGTGYPNATKGTQISLYGRIISMADVYDALTSNRPYRKALIPSEAIEYIMGGGNSLFDPELVNAFISKIAPYPSGTCVSLSNGKIGIVAENYTDCCLRPKIKIIKHGNIYIEPYYIDLRNDLSTLDVTITGIADPDLNSEDIHDAV